MEGMYYVKTVDEVDYFVKGELIAIPNKRENMMARMFCDIDSAIFDKRLDDTKKKLSELLKVCLI